MWYVKCLVSFCLVPESYESSDNVSDESSDDDEDEELDEISIYFRAVWTHSCSFACSTAAFAFFCLQERVAPYSYKRPFKLVTFVLVILLVL